MKLRHSIYNKLAIGFFMAMAFSALPAICAAQGRIGFVTDHDGDYEIYLMNPDGTNQVRLTDNTAGDANPAISPDGRKIAFVSDRDGDWEIYTMNADGTNVTRLTNSPGYDAEPAFSPDGSKIAFTSFRAGSNHYDVYVMNADGTNQINLTNSPESDGEPNFSPDGSRIVFRSSRDYNTYQEIYVMNADGSNQTRLTFDPGDDACPKFSPDGSKITFTAGDTDVDLNIHVMNADGTNEVSLTNSGLDELRSTFSPDGSKIAYETILEDGNYEIYIMDADGSNKVRVTHTSIWEGNVTWGVEASSMPVLSNVAATSQISENGVAVLSGNISDLNTADNFTLSVDWGDGSELQHFSYPAGTSAFSETHRYVDDDPIETGSDVHSIILTLNDHRDGTDTESTSVTVNNLAPSLTNLMLSPATINVGGISTLSGIVSDPGARDSHTVQIYWNDGSPATTVNLAAGGSFSVPHAFDTTGNFTIRVAVTDDDGGQTGGGANITVNPQSATPNAPRSLTAVATSTSQINLAWNDTSDNETNFLIERCQAAKKCSSFMTIASVGANTVSFSDRGLKANTTYFHRVRATNGGGGSAYSNVASAKTRTR